VPKSAKRRAAKRDAVTPTNAADDESGYLGSAEAERDAKAMADCDAFYEYMLAAPRPPAYGDYSRNYPSMLTMLDVAGARAIDGAAAAAVALAAPVPAYGGVPRGVGLPLHAAAALKLALPSAARPVRRLRACPGALPRVARRAWSIVLGRCAVFGPSAALSTGPVCCLCVTGARAARLTDARWRAGPGRMHRRRAGRMVLRLRSPGHRRCGVPPLVQHRGRRAAGLALAAVERAGHARGVRASGECGDKVSYDGESEYRPWPTYVHQGRRALPAPGCHVVNKEVRRERHGACAASARGQARARVHCRGSHPRASACARLV